MPVGGGGILAGWREVSAGGGGYGQPAQGKDNKRYKTVNRYYS